jgi:hypothetical protein
VHDAPVAQQGHERRFAGQGGDGEAGPQGLAEHGQVRGDPEEPLGPPGAEAETGDDLIKNEDYAVAVAQAAGTFEVAVFRDDDRGVAKDRFHDEGRHLAGAMLEEGLQGPEVVPGQHDEVGQGVRGLAGRLGGSGKAARGRQGRRARESTVEPPVVVALELHHQGSAGGRPGQA